MIHELIDYDLGQQAWLAKIDRDANLLWSRTFGGAMTNGALDVVHSLDGGYAFTGHFTDPEVGYWNPALVITDAQGLNPATTIYPTEFRRTGMSLAALPDGGGYLLGFVTGWLDNIWSGSGPLQVIRTHPNGAVDWEVASGLWYSQGGGAYWVSPLEGGGMAGVGALNGEITLMTYDATGMNVSTNQWVATRFGDTAYDATFSPDGDLVMTGSLYSEDDVDGRVEKMVLLKMSLEGAVDWAWTLPQAQNTRSKGQAILASEDGGFVALGYQQRTFSGEPYIPSVRLIKISPNHVPLARLNATPERALAHTEFQFDATDSRDIDEPRLRDGGILRHAIDGGGRRGRGRPGPYHSRGDPCHWARGRGRDFRE